MEQTRKIKKKQTTPCQSTCTNKKILLNLHNGHKKETSITSGQSVGNL